MADADPSPASPVRLRAAPVRINRPGPPDRELTGTANAIESGLETESGSRRV